MPALWQANTVILRILASFGEFWRFLASFISIQAMFARVLPAEMASYPLLETFRLDLWREKILECILEVGDWYLLNPGSGRKEKENVS